MPSLRSADSALLLSYSWGMITQRKRFGLRCQSKAHISGGLPCKVNTEEKKILCESVKKLVAGLLLVLKP